MTPTPFEIATTHEAGHATICWYYGGKLELAAVGPHRNGLISYSHEGFGPKYDWSHPYSKQAVSIILNGLSATFRLASDWGYDGCYADIGGAADLLESRGWVKPEGYNLNEFYRDWGDESRIFCFDDNNFKLITALAKELQIQKRMDGQAMAKFLEDASLLGRAEKALPWPEHNKIS